MGLLFGKRRGFNAAGLYQLLYLGLPLVCLLHFKEAEALPPRQGSSPWGGLLVLIN
jgi:hypothetical protein